MNQDQNSDAAMDLLHQPIQMEKTDPKLAEMKEKLMQVETDRMTPMEALILIHDLKKIIS